MMTIASFIAIAPSPSWRPMSTRVNWGSGVPATPTAGFINLRLVPAFWQGTIATILRERDAYGRGATQPERISLEFGSANPTGPLVVVQGRTLAIGDTLAARAPAEPDET